MSSRFAVRSRDDKKWQAIQSLYRSSIQRPRRRRGQAWSDSNRTRTRSQGRACKAHEHSGCAAARSAGEQKIARLIIS